MAVFKVAGDNLLDRIQNAQSLLTIIKANEAQRSNEEENKIFKGLFYVVLYGAIERCIVDCVSICINHLNGLSLTVGDIRPELWALAFDPDCTRIEQNSNSKKWGNRNQLFVQLYGDKMMPSISEILFPTSIGNIKMEQVAGVWRTFGIQEPYNPDITKGYDQTLINVADYRMQIAHGRSTAAEVGAHCTSADMQKTLEKVDFYCNYVITCFENYVSNKDFRR